LAEIHKKGVKKMIVILIIGMIVASIGLTVFEKKMGHAFWPIVTFAGFMLCTFAMMHL